jgi:hypothetical protein
MPGGGLESAPLLRKLGTQIHEVGCYLLFTIADVIGITVSGIASLNIAIEAQYCLPSISCKFGFSHDLPCYWEHTGSRQTPHLSKLNAPGDAFESEY